MKPCIRRFFLAGSLLVTVPLVAIAQTPGPPAPINGRVKTIATLSVKATGMSRTEDADRLGKTDRQIAAMGIVKWTDFYCGKKQWSTASQTQAASIFGASLRRVNDRRIAAFPASSKARTSLQTIRSVSTTYSNCMLEIAARDGGTMWIPMRAGVEAATEELVSDLIPLVNQKPAAPTVARKKEINRLIARTEAGLARAADDLQEPGYAAQKIHLQKARASFESVKKQFASASWPGSLVILEWYALRAGEERTGESELPESKPLPQVSTPRPGSVERKAILDALRPTVEKTVKKPVVFLVGDNSPKVRDNWAFVNAKTLDKNQEPLGEEFHGGETVALLHRQNGKWEVMVWGFATDTRVLDKAMQQYPEGTRAIFGLPEK
jgi:hypothetical protein